MILFGVQLDHMGKSVKTAFAEYQFCFIKDCAGSLYFIFELFTARKHQWIQCSNIFLHWCQGSRVWKATLKLFTNAGIHW